MRPAHARLSDTHSIITNEQTPERKRAMGQFHSEADTFHTPDRDAMLREFVKFVRDNVRHRYTDRELRQRVDEMMQEIYGANLHIFTEVEKRARSEFY